MLCTERTAAGGSEMADTHDKLAVDSAGVVADVVRLLVNGFHPLRIILFGSRARGDARTDSDYDLVVVMPGDAVPSSLTSAMRLALLDIPGAFDIVPVAETPWTKWAGVPLTLESQIARDGKVVFDAQR